MLLATARTLPAQGVISGRALLPNSTRPLACVDAALRRTDGTVVATTSTRDDGTFEFAAPAPGRYVVAFSTLGMAEAVAPFDSLHPASDIDRTIFVPLTAVDSLFERIAASQNDTRYPRVTRNSGAPRYPVTERNNGREGGVVAALVVNAEGRVDSALSWFLYATAEPFEASVREAFARLRFEPVQVGAQARCSLLVAPFVFGIAGNGANAFGRIEIGAPPAGDVAPSPPEQLGVCPPLPVETDGTPPVYLSCHVDRQARETRSNAVLNWEPAAGEIRPNACFRVELRFVVDTLGVPEAGTVALVSTNNKAFGDAFLAFVPDLRYAPARLKGRPVRQVVMYKESVGVRVTVNDGLGHGSSTPSRRARC